MYTKTLYYENRSSTRPEIVERNDYRTFGLFAVFVIGFWDQNAIFTQKLSDFGIISFAQSKPVAYLAVT